jgi:hypothetical protein
MSYADVLGLYKGAGKGVGPGVPEDLAQGGSSGMLRAAGGVGSGISKGLATLSPKVSAAMNAQDYGTRGAYADMMYSQNQQDSDAQGTSHARNIFGMRPALDKYFNQSGSVAGGTKPDQPM